MFAGVSGPCSLLSSDLHKQSGELCIGHQIAPVYIIRKRLSIRAHRTLPLPSASAPTSAPARDPDEIENRKAMAPHWSDAGSYFAGCRKPMGVGGRPADSGTGADRAHCDHLPGEP